MNQENNSAFEPIDHSNDIESLDKKSGRKTRNVYVDNTYYKVANILMIVQGSLLLAAAFSFMILGITFIGVTAPNVYFWATSAAYFGMMAPCLLFGIWIVVVAAIQLKPAKANRANEIMLLVLACLSLSIITIPAIVLISLGLAGENSNSSEY